MLSLFLTTKSQKLNALKVEIQVHKIENLSIFIAAV